MRPYSFWGAGITLTPKYRPNYASPIYELGHVGYSGFDSHTTTLAPPPKRGFFSRNNTTGDWFLNFFRERFTDVLT